MRFWDKAGRVLAYKQQTLVAARKKVVYDKHLDFLVGQTQRYSSLLAERLAAAAAGEEGSPSAGGSPAPPALPAPEAREGPWLNVAGPRHRTAYSLNQLMFLHPEQSWGATVTQVKLPTAAASEAVPSQSVAQQDPPRTLAGASPDAPGTEAAAPAAASAADADREWVGGAADDEADDEGTLEEEEVPLPSWVFTTCHACERQISDFINAKVLQHI